MKPFRVAILYGSQTGNAQSIAESVHDVCKHKGVESTLLACDGWKKMKPELTEWSAVVFVVSTTGNGDAPENTEKFWRFLKRRTQPKDLLAGVSFALLGLGDTNYDKFCYMGKSFDKRLRELGATPFHASAFADEATNMAETVEPWLSSLYQSLLALQRGSNGPIAFPGEAAGDDTDDAVAVSAVELRTVSTDSNRENSGGNNGAANDKGGHDRKLATAATRDLNGNDEIPSLSLSLSSVTEIRNRQTADTAAVTAAAVIDATTGQSGMVGGNCSFGDLANATCSTENGVVSAESMGKSERGNGQIGVRERNAGNQDSAAVATLIVETATDCERSKISKPSKIEDVITVSGVVETSPSLAKREGDAVDVEASPKAEGSGPLPSHRIAVLFGSQTGNAKAIAERVHEGCKERGLDSTLNTCDRWKQMKPELKQWTALVLVVSTTGNGDAPENMERFWRFIKRRTQPKDLLEGLPFTVLGLGDTNYDKFCWIGKSLEKRLRELGAVPFYRAAFADEATTMEETVEPWVGSVYSSLRAVILGARTVEHDEGRGRAQTKTEAKTPSIYEVGLTSTNGNGATAMGEVSREGTPAVSPRALARNSDDESLVSSGGKLSALAEMENEAGVADNTAAMASLSVSSGGPPGNASPTAENSAKERDGSVDGAVSSAVGPFESSSGSNQSSEGIPEKRTTSEVVLSPETAAPLPESAVPLPESAVPVPVEAATAATPAVAAAGEAEVLKSWSPSKESGTLPLSRFLDAEHMAPGYSPRRDDIPKLRQRAPDIDFYNLEVVNGRRAAGGGGSGDAWLMRAVHRSSSVDSGHTCDWPFEASVLAARYLTEGGRQADRRVILLELSLKDSGITYEPGDVIGIRCSNPASDAEYVLQRLQVTLPAGAGPDEPFQHSLRSLPSPCTLRDALLTRLDLRAALRRPVIRALAEFCEDEREKAWMELLCAKTCGAGIYAKFVSAQSLTLCELLEAFPSCKPRAGALLSLLPPLPPRYYSVASSQLATPSSLTIAFSVVSYSLPAPTRDAGEVVRVGRQEDEEGEETGCVIRRRGLCTNWLEKVLTPYLQRRGGATVGGGRGAGATTGFTVNGRRFGGVGEEVTSVSIPLFVKPTKEFLLPASSKWPCVLIGPGTGVAPFVGFLKHREEQFARRRQTVDAVCSGTWRGGYEISLEGEEDEAQAYRGREGRGDMWLFFGCRHKDQDWVFRKEVEGFLSKGTLSRLSTAFSRDHPKKFYVQDRILDSGAELSQLILREGAYVFVCGDGNAMAQGVHQALVKVLVEHGGGVVGGEKGAEAVLKAMKARNRYVLDVWS